jgi:hypothetical protein
MITQSYLVISQNETPIMLIVTFWAVKPCGHAGGYQRFGGTCCLHL